MAKQNSATVGYSASGVCVGDPMPRITLPLSSGALFDSWAPMTSGMARVYWLSDALSPAAERYLLDALSPMETLLHVVAKKPPTTQAVGAPWIIDAAGELTKAFGATGPIAILVDALGRVASILPSPTPDSIVASSAQLYEASTSAVVHSQAPVLLLDRVLESAFCKKLIEYWEINDKLVDEISSDAGASVSNADVKRRTDVPVVEPHLFTLLRDCLVRRVNPLIWQAFHTPVRVIEGPRIGCYDSSFSGWFRRHRDNTGRYTAHRQFAVSLNLNPAEDYDGGEVRFPEFGRQLYCPPEGGALVFSCSLLHEVMPVTRGRRLGVFTFLSSTGPAESRTTRS